MRISLTCAAVLATGVLVADPQQDSLLPPSTAALAVDKEIFRSNITMTGQKLHFPSGEVQMVATRVDLVPGAATAIHRHPYPRAMYVVEGTITMTMEDGMTHDYPKGSFAIEGIEVWHITSNRSTVPVRILWIDTVQAGVKNAIPKPR